MPEISARDLRRLKGLDTRLRKAQEDKRKQAGEARALRRRVEASERDVRAAGDQLNALLEENQRLASELATVSSDLETAASAAAEARAKAESASAEAEAARKAAEEAIAQTKGLTLERDRLAERVKKAEAQLAGRGIDPVVPPSRAAELVENFIGELRSGMGALDVGTGELRLRVGVAMVEDQPGFVLPTPSSSEATISSLHEITLRFERRLE